MYRFFPCIETPSDISIYGIGIFQESKIRPIFLDISVLSMYRNSVRYCDISNFSMNRECVRLCDILYRIFRYNTQTLANKSIYSSSAYKSKTSPSSACPYPTIHHPRMKTPIESLTIIIDKPGIKTFRYDNPTLSKLPARL